MNGVGWGYNYQYELGTGSRSPSHKPVGMLVEDVVQIAGFIFATIVLKKDGTVEGVGNNRHSQLCNGVWQTPPFPYPQQAIGLTGVSAIAACGVHAMALLAGGAVKTWASNNFGLLGVGLEPLSNEEGGKEGSPILLESFGHTPQTPLVGGEGGTPLTGVAAIAAGDYHALALKQTGTVTFRGVSVPFGDVYGWGASKGGQLGAAYEEESESSPVPVSLAGFAGKAVAVAAGYKHSLVLMSNGTVVGMGFNQQGQLGNGLSKTKEPATLVPGITDAIAIAAGGNMSAIIKADGSVWTAGDNSVGALGLGTIDGEPHTAFAEVFGLPSAASYVFTSSGAKSGNEQIVMAVCSKKAFLWGTNSHHKLVEPSTVDASGTPVEISLPSDVLSLAASEYTCFAVVAGEAPPITATAELLDNETRLHVTFPLDESTGEYQALISAEPTQQEEEEEKEPKKTTVKLGKTATSTNLTLNPKRGYTVTIRHTGAVSTFESVTFDTGLLPGYPPFILEGVPSIGGTVAAGQVLTARQGWWARATSQFSFTWLRNGKAVATGRTYTATAADVGHLSLAVVATNPSGSTSLATPSEGGSEEPPDEKTGGGGEGGGGGTAARAASDAGRNHPPADVSLNGLVLKSLSKGKRGFSTGVGDVVVDGTLEETVEGASSVTLELIDRDYLALQSGIFGTRVVASIDGDDYRQTQLSILDPTTQTLQALLENRLVSEMREHKRPLRALRGHLTRAEFMLSMLRELHLPYRFICPELHRKQPVEPLKAEAPTSLAEVGKGKHLSGHLTVKGVQATSEQLTILSEALATAEALGASERAAGALVVALIQEATVSNPVGGDADSSGPLQVRASTARGLQKRDGHGTLDPRNVEEVCAHFLTAGYYHGGAIALAKANPTWSISKIGSEVEGPEVEYPSKWNAEAMEIVKDFQSGAGTFAGVSPAAETIRTATYEYSRGRPGEPEDTYTCCLRLAQEVGWRFFVVGSDIYFVNDNDLKKAKPKFKISYGDEGLIGVRFDVEMGGRTITVHGHREPKPSEGELEVRIDRHKMRPGDVVELEGYGPGDMRWLVQSTKRSIFDALTTVAIKAPQVPLKEPAPEISTSTVGGQAPSGVPAGIPKAASGHYRNPPTQGPKGVTVPKKAWNPQGLPVARWIVPMLEYASQHGWTGSITSGYRPGYDPNTSSGKSEHSGTQYPAGAVDFGGPTEYANRESFFAACKGYTGLPIIPAQFTNYHGYPSDGGHASGTGK